MVVDPTFQVISMLAPFSIVKESPGILASVPVSYKSKVGGKGFRFNSRLQSILVKKSKHQELGSSHSQWSRERMSASVLGLSSPLYSPRPSPGNVPCPITDVQAFSPLWEDVPTAKQIWSVPHWGLLSGDSRFCQVDARRGTTSQICLKYRDAFTSDTTHHPYPAGLSLQPVHHCRELGHEKELPFFPPFFLFFPPLFLSLLFVVLCFETESLYTALAVLELTI